jgi:hypothetical protein
MIPMTRTSSGNYIPHVEKNSTVTLMNSTILFLHQILDEQERNPMTNEILNFPTMIDAQKEAANLNEGAPLGLEFGYWAARRTVRSDQFTVVWVEPMATQDEQERNP